MTDEKLAHCCWQVALVTGFGWMGVYIGLSYGKLTGPRQGGEGSIRVAFDNVYMAGLSVQLALRTELSIMLCEMDSVH